MELFFALKVCALSDFQGSTFDTLLAVYTGNSVGILTEIGSNDDTLGNKQSEVIFKATNGTIYHIAVDGYGGMTGLAYLSLISGFGDVNGDNQIGLDDAMFTLQVLSGYAGSAIISSGSDMNGDGRVGLEEVLFIFSQLGK